MTASEPLLAFEHIVQSFPSPQGGPDLSVLADISFTVERRSFTAVIGPSGCGKSTLLHMAAGTLRPTGGRVRHDGRTVDGINRQVGYVPQQAQLFPWKTLAQNVEFPLAVRRVAVAERRQRVAAALEAVGLAGFGDHYPHQLSGGMQKRGSIARTMIYRPEIILMDEPFGALDAQTRMVMQNDLQTLAAADAATVLLVTHDLTEAITLADRVIILSQRPTRLLATVTVPLPRPRNVFEPFRAPGFTDTYDEVWSIFRGEVAGAL